MPEVLKHVVHIGYDWLALRKHSAGTTVAAHLH